MTPLLAPYEWLRLPYGQDKNIASKCHIYENNNKNKVKFTIWFFLPFVVAATWHYCLSPFILYRMLQWQMNFGNIVTFFRESFVLWKEVLHTIYYFFLKTNLMSGSKNKVYFLEINNMIYLNHVHIVDFLASDSRFQLIYITYFHPHWNWKPNLIGNEGEKENFLLCSATWFIMLVLL